MKIRDVTLMILADFLKAFNTLQYKILITKLHSVGFSKSFLSWLTSYLLNRSQFVQINDWAFIPISVKFVVPQGSILGSMLIIFHISDLQDNLPANVATYQYTTIYASCHPNDPPQKTEDLNCVQTRLRSETYRPFSFISIFYGSYFKAAGQIASKFSVKYICNEYFKPGLFLDHQKGRKNGENNDQGTSTSQIDEYSDCPRVSVSLCNPCTHALCAKRI